MCEILKKHSQKCFCLTCRMQSRPVISEFCMFRYRWALQPLLLLVKPRSMDLRWKNLSKRSSRLTSLSTARTPDQVCSSVRLSVCHCSKTKCRRQVQTYYFTIKLYQTKTINKEAKSHKVGQKV